MKGKPIEPLPVHGKIYFQELIRKDNFTLKELNKYFSAFSVKYNVPLEKIQLRWDENWTGYESVDINFELCSEETDEQYQERKKNYEKDTVKYKEDLKEWKRLQHSENQKREVENKKAKKQKYLSEIEELKKKIEDLK